MTTFLVPVVMAGGALSNRLRQNRDISEMADAQLQWVLQNRLRTTYGLTQLLARRQMGLTPDEAFDLQVRSEILQRQTALGLR